jgi:hypothetical protein
MAIVLICGKREEGKSTRMLSIVRDFSPRVLILDHRSQFNMGRVVSNPDELYEALEDGETFISYHVQLDIDSSDQQEEEQIIQVLRLVWLMGREEAPEQRFSFVIDEAGELDRYGAVARAARRMIRQIRLNTVQVFFLCHSPKDIGPQLRKLLTELYLFNLTDPLDIKWLEETGVSAEHIEIVRNLPAHHHIHLSLRTRDSGFVLYDKPEAWNIDWKGATLAPLQTP